MDTLIEQPLDLAVKNHKGRAVTVMHNRHPELIEELGPYTLCGGIFEEDLPPNTSPTFFITGNQCPHCGCFMENTAPKHHQCEACHKIWFFNDVLVVWEELKIVSSCPAGR